MVDVNLNLYKSLYFSNMETIPFELKKGIVNIKPILVKDYHIYQWASSILQIDKNHINDAKIISMSYLDFIVSYLLNDSNPKIAEEQQNKLAYIFNLCLGEEKISIVEDCGKTCIAILDDNSLVKAIITSKEFEKIAKIILAYNDIDYDERMVSDDIKSVVDAYIKSRYSDIYSPTFESIKAYVSSKIGKSFKEIGDMPYREFELIYHSLRDMDIFFSRKIIQASYKYDVKEDIQFPLNEKPKTIYDEAFTSTSVLNGKGIGGIEALNQL